ncbi:hypothetical protein EJB05_10918, partial [Eragrostis curvula]
MLFKEKVVVARSIRATSVPWSPSMDGAQQNVGTSISRSNQQFAGELRRGKQLGRTKSTTVVRKNDVAEQKYMVGQRNRKMGDKMMGSKGRFGCGTTSPHDDSPFLVPFVMDCRRSRLVFLVMWALACFRGWLSQFGGNEAG